MRRMMVVLSVLAIALVAVAPAMAQVSQGFSEEDVESGDVEPTVEISNSGDNVSICGTVLQSANSGNVQNEQGVVQYQDTVDDIEFEGSTITFEVASEGECTQTLEQAAAAAA